MLSFSIISKGQFPNVICAKQFSGGLDSAIIAALADRIVPAGEQVDLINVAFAKTAQVIFLVTFRYPVQKKVILPSDYTRNTSKLPTLPTSTAKYYFQP